MTHKEATAYPVTAKALADKLIYVSDLSGTLIGTASDGTNVQVGHLLSLPATERYLVANPTPESW